MRMLDGRYEGDWIMDGRGVGNRLPGIGYAYLRLRGVDHNNSMKCALDQC